MFESLQKFFSEFFSTKAADEFAAILENSHRDIGDLALDVSQWTEHLTAMQEAHKALNTIFEPRLFNDMAVFKQEYIDQEEEKDALLNLETYQTACRKAKTFVYGLMDKYFRNKNPNTEPLTVGGCKRLKEWVKIVKDYETICQKRAALLLLTEEKSAPDIYSKNFVPR